MLHLPLPILNGVTLTHEELRVLHLNMRIAVHAATGHFALDGPRLLRMASGEYYTLKAHGRDAHGNLLASVTVRLPWCGAKYVRRVRLVRKSRSTIGVELG